uniref:Uncharacterized protein n=1 Tax=Tetranychus urticae TaxID=32264 RepID=T1K4I5_TETUR
MILKNVDIFKDKSDVVYIIQCCHSNNLSVKCHIKL